MSVLFISRLGMIEVKSQLL